MASSKTFTPATALPGSAVIGNGLEGFARGAPKASVEGSSEVIEEPKLSVGTVNEEDRLSAAAGEDGLGVCMFVDSEPEADSPNASSNEVGGISMPLVTNALAGVLSTDDFNLCFKLDKGSSSLSLSDSSSSSSLSRALRSVSPSGFSDIGIESGISSRGGN